MTDRSVGLTSCEGFCPYDEQDEQSARYFDSIDKPDEASKVRAQSKERREGCIGSVVVGPGLEECGLEHRNPIPEQRLAEGISPEAASLIAQGRYTEAEFLIESELQ